MGDSEKKIKLEKNIGLYNGVSLIISVIVGGGIFISPKVTTNDSDSLSLSVFFTFSNIFFF